MSKQELISAEEHSTRHNEQQQQYRHEHRRERALAEAPKNPAPWKKSWWEWAQERLQYRIPDHQKVLGEQVMRSPLSESFVDLEPRGHGKSHTISEILMIFIICESTCNELNHYLDGWLNAPNDLRIMHIASSLRQDKKYLKAILTNLKRNPRIHKYYGHILELPGSTEEFNLKYRKVRKEPTIQGVGIGTDIVGWHGDLICLDDVIQEDKSKDINVSLKKKDWADETLEGCVDPNTRLWWVGTRKSKTDIYSHIMGLPGTIVRLKQAIIYENCPHCKTALNDSNFIYETMEMRCICGRFMSLEEVESKVLWPAVRNYPWLVKKRRKMGPLKFSREMQNKPITEEGNFLKADWLRYFTKLPASRSDIYFYIGVDPAVGQSPDADYTVISVIGEWANKFYLVDLQRGRWSWNQMKKQLKSAWKKWKPLQIGFESNFFQRIMSQDLIDTTLMPIVEVIHHKQKDTRIATTIGTYAESGRFHVHRDLPHKDDFDEEYLDFPEAGHDDILDSIATCIEVAVFPSGAVLFG